MPDAIPFIIGIPPPIVNANDTLSWNLTPTGTFSVSSAYAQLLESAWEAIDSKWSWIWSLAVTPRIRMFVWLTLMQRLMTNVERCRRGLSSNAPCLSCGCVSETIIHILRDCPPTRLFWLSILPPESCGSFFAATLDDWVTANIREVHNLQGSTILWACLFPTLLWQLWKRRNDFIFTNTCLPLPAIYRISVAWAKHFAEVSEAARVPRASIVSHLQWLPPAPGWVARSSGVGRILVQSDCSHATKLLIDALQPSHGVLQQDHELPLVRAIVFLCQEDWQVNFQWIPREQNMVADCLAKLTSPSQFNLLVSNVIPAQARPLLDRDREGPPYLLHSRGEEGWVVCRAFKKRSTGGQAKSIGGGWDSSYFYDEPSGLSSVVDPMEYMSRQPQSFLPLCKQETATEADNLNNFVYSHQFIELPPLESPSLPLMNKPITISIVSENNNINYEEGGEEDQRRMCNSSTTKKVTDWRTLDKFVASQLSHEDRYNNGGDQQGPGAASISSFDANSCSNSDMALLLLQSSREEGNKLKELLSWSSDCDIGICMFDK
ncbi:hypothetical protein V6N11_041084 [Hibiscus sabdariffa]|uniref:Reverse transcriptase zinc-binding domain-containing protein n=1 Tax=Hibiscus sabdariffa TaxID=183260 RepID=A0ABR2RJC9_9ROSI